MGAWRRMRHALRFARKPAEEKVEEDAETIEKSHEGEEEPSDEASHAPEVHEILDLQSTDDMGAAALGVDGYVAEQDGRMASHTVSESERLEVAEKMFAIVLSIERTKRVIRDLEEGFGGLAESDQVRKSKMRAQVDALEAKIFSKARSFGPEAYHSLATAKINALKEAMLALRDRQAKLLQDTKQQVDKSHLQAKLGRLGGTMSRVDFLRRVTFLQSRVRSFLARRRLVKLRAAARTLQAVARLRRRRAAALRIQALQRRCSARRVADQRLGAIFTLQRFVMAKNAIAEAQEIAHDLRLAAAMRERAANQLWRSRLLGSSIKLWVTFCRERKHVRAVLRRSVEKWTLQHMAHAFKTWFAGTRRTFEIRAVAGHRVLHAYEGSHMPLVHLYKQHYLRTSLEAQRPHVLRTTWRHMTLLQEVPPREKPARNFANPSAPAAALVDASGRPSLAAVKTAVAPHKSEGDNRNEFDWYLPAKLKHSKDAAARRHPAPPQVTSEVFASLAEDPRGATQVFATMEDRKRQIQKALIDLERIKDRHALHKMVRRADALTPRDGVAY